MTLREATQYLMNVIDGWYSAALVVKYTVGGFRHYLFFQKVCGPLSQEGHVYRSIQRHRRLWHLLRKHCTAFRSDALAPYTGSP